MADRALENLALGSVEFFACSYLVGPRIFFLVIKSIVK